MMTSHVIKQDLNFTRYHGVTEGNWETMDSLGRVRMDATGV
jgi:hypothetical protein